MEALKNMYSRNLLEDFAGKVKRVYPPFDSSRFIDRVFDAEWENRELKERYRHITLMLGDELPSEFEAAVDILRKLSHECHGFPYMFFPDFVEVYGLEHIDAAIGALKDFTSVCSSEFAIRPFIEKDPERVLGILLEWTRDPDEHVRRLASEGCRPRLPWASPLRKLKADPSSILPILERLKADESEYVRRSVANNLNDISKDHPELVLRIAREWLAEKQPLTDGVIRRGCRTLLKNGNSEALRLFGFGGGDDDAPVVAITGLSVTPEVIRLGDEIEFVLHLSCSEPSSFRLQFQVDYVKASGKTSPKRFHLTEKQGFCGSGVIRRRLSFRDYTTRKHYPGIHRLSILLNGIEAAETSFLIHPAE